ncbi:MAG: ABC transporter permease [Desulfurococcales archaeon ex4484_58]|nr:MAG: ABC transporter permease [Desulfurococcales archaeon ex4484_58]
MVSSSRTRIMYTGIDYTLLGVVAIVSGLIFWGTWTVYKYASFLPFGLYMSRLLSYGLWFIGAPLAASLIRKPGSAFLGETLGALVETILPTAGGFTNLIYGVSQGAASEIAYLLFRYKRYDMLTGALAGALAAPPCIALDILLFREIFPIPVTMMLLAAAAASGAIYGAIAAKVAQTLR